MTFTSTSTDDLYAHHLRGFVLLPAGQALARAMTFVAVTYLARALGIEMFGVIGFAAAVAAYFLLLVDATRPHCYAGDRASQESSVERGRKRFRVCITYPSFLLLIAQRRRRVIAL